MIALLTALMFATVQSPPDEARMQRIGPHVPACINGQASPGELIEVCAERLAVRAEVRAARRAEEQAQALRLWGEPCDALTDMAGECPAEQQPATYARHCIDYRQDDESLEVCVARREMQAERMAERQRQAAERAAAPPAPQTEPEPEAPAPADRNGCRRERVVSPDGQSVSYSFVCNRTWTR